MIGLPSCSSPTRLLSLAALLIPIPSSSAFSQSLVINNHIDSHVGQRPSCLVSLRGSYLNDFRGSADNPDTRFHSVIPGPTTNSDMIDGTTTTSYLDSLPVVSQEEQQTTTASSSSAFDNSGVSSSSALDVCRWVPVLSLEQADAIAENAIGVCRRNGFNPVTVCVLDQAGHVVVSKRMDGCSPVGYGDFAKAKAFSCIVNGYPSRNFRDKYTANFQDDSLAKLGQMLGMVAASGNRMANFPGGVLIRLGGTEHVVGAVGVSGASGDEDEYCAIRGVLESRSGLSPVPEQHSCSTVKDV